MPDDLSLLNGPEHRCPHCHNDRFLIGPRGGLAINIKCATCGAKWWFCPPFTPMPIDNDDVFYKEPPVTLSDWYRANVADFPWIIDANRVH